MVLAHISSFRCEGVQHHGRVDEIFLHTLKPCVQFLKPHQLSSIWRKQKTNLKSYILKESKSPNFSFYPLFFFYPQAIHSCENNIGSKLFNLKDKDGHLLLLSNTENGTPQKTYDARQKIYSQQKAGCTIMLS